LTRAQPWTTPNNHSLSGYLGATSFNHYPLGLKTPKDVPRHLPEMSLKNATQLHEF
jgi:hypothetical protein